MAKGLGLVTQLAIAALLGAGSMVAFGGDLGSLPALARQAISGSCDIKGNVSQASGERIYHVPGQRYYAGTKIDGRYGERWFCSEQEARQAGWRRPRV